MLIAKVQDTAELLNSVAGKLIDRSSYCKM